MLAIAFAAALTAASTPKPARPAPEVSRSEICSALIADLVRAKLSADGIATRLAISGDHAAVLAKLAKGYDPAGSGGAIGKLAAGNETLSLTVGSTEDEVARLGAQLLQALDEARGLCR